MTKADPADVLPIAAEAMIAEVLDMNPALLRRTYSKLSVEERWDVFKLVRQVSRFPTFREYVEAHDKRFTFYPHIAVLSNVIDRIVSRELTRVMVWMPPRFMKTETITIRLTAYMARRFPERMNGIISYNDASANIFSRKAKAKYREWGGQFVRGAEGVKQWETPQGGGCWAAGIGGSITGKGITGMMVVDDPIKDEKQAQSALYREYMYDWFRSTASTRLDDPAAPIVLVHTRWHETDLSGRILTELKESEFEDREPWHIVRLPAIIESAADLEPLDLPAPCTQEPDWRTVGETLGMPKFTADKLRLIMKTKGDYVAASLYQQNPRPREGRMFKFKWFVTAKTRPVHVKARVRYVDLAGTEDAGDFTAAVLMVRTTMDSYYVIDVAAGQWGIGRREEELVKVAKDDFERYGHDVTWWLEMEVGIAGKDRTKDLVRRLQAVGIIVRTERASGSKTLRAEPFAAAMAEDNVRLVDGSWVAGFRDEALDFPSGGHDDRVDAAAGAYNKLVNLGEASVGTYGIQ